jgi:glucose/arabinose dehydrogenase
MKQLFIALLACLPCMAMAQNTWEIPESQTQQEETVKQKKAEKAKAQKTHEDPKYLTGAVPEVDGKVVFTLDKDVPGMSTEAIYQAVYEVMQSITQEEGQFPASKIAVVNKAQHTVAARLKEWLVFSDSFLSLDRTVFNYTLIAQATDGHVKMTMERMTYEYETDRSSGMQTTADKWITDKEALNGSHTKLLKYNGKFRRKTIDRKDNIFGRVCSALNIAY